MEPRVNRDEINAFKMQESSKNASSKVPMELTFFKVVAVNAINRTIDIEFIHGSVKETGVSYLTPFISADSGMDYVPSVNDIGIVARTSSNGRVVIGFIAGAERSGGLPLSEGDILTKTGIMSVVKQDSAGNIIIATETGATIQLTPKGTVYCLSKELYLASETRERFDGLSFGHLVSSEEFYEDTIASTGSIEDNGGLDALINTIMTTGAIEVPAERFPIMRVHKINKINSEGEQEVIDVEFDDSGAPIIYEIEVLDKGTDNKLASITFDRRGNILIKANNLIYDVNNIINL